MSPQVKTIPLPRMQELIGMLGLVSWKWQFLPRTIVICSIFTSLTLPATDSNSTELKINRSPITNDDLLKVWYWLIASEDANVTHSGSFAHQTQTPLPSGFSPTSLSGLQLWLDAADVDGDKLSRHFTERCECFSLGRQGRW